MSEHAPACPHCGCPQAVIQKLRQERLESAPTEARRTPEPPLLRSVGQELQWSCPTCRTLNASSATACKTCGHAERPQQPPSTFVAWIGIIWGLAIIGYFVIEVADGLDYMSKGARWGHIIALLFGGAMVVAGIARIVDANKRGRG